MIDFSGFSIGDFAKKKPVVFSLICLLIVLFVLGLIILLIQTSPDKKPSEIPEKFEADAPVLIPDAPNVEKDYYFSRTTGNQWHKDEVDKWFTYPDEDAMEKVSETNDKIVKEILEAAP